MSDNNIMGSTDSDQLKLIIEYMDKRINQIDEFREKLRIEYPDLLPSLLELNSATIFSRLYNDQ